MKVALHLTQSNDTIPPLKDKPEGQAYRAHGSHGAAVLLLSLLIVFTEGCALPSIENRTESTTLSPEQARDTALGKAVAPLVESHPGETGVLALGNPRESFAVRVLLARAATRTLDVQYYIWHGDTTGKLLMAALHGAAERGVRVRLLLDDNGTAGVDAELLTLDAHPNIEVRLFNPFVNRRFKPLGYTYDFFRLNRRMHNKSLTADAQAAVVGGRNVGDEYFGATSGVLKADLDALLVGPIVKNLASDFDRYWASQSSYPVDRIVAALTPEDQSRTLTDIQSAEDSPEAQRYVDAIRESTFIAALLDGDPGLQWSPVDMVTDDPAKGLGAIKGEGLLIRQLDTILEKPTRSVVLVSPYFGKRLI